MKGTSLFVSIALFVAIAVLYVLHFTGGSNSSADSGNGERSSAGGDGLKLAYVKADSVILNYVLSEELHDEFTKNQEAYTKEYGTKRQSFERDASAFQEKLQRGGFLSEQSAIRERDRLVGIEQDIAKMDQELSGKLGEMQAANNKQILDSLMNCLNRYNAKMKYDYILNSSSVLIGNEGDNITAEILKQMNEIYTASKAK